MKLREWFELVRVQLAREEGQTMAEYGLLISLIALAAILGVTALGGSLNGFFDSLAGQF